MKIIKPVLNSKGEQKRGKLKKGDWYFDYSTSDYSEWDVVQEGSDEIPIYFADEWPKENERYFYFDFNNDKFSSTLYSPTSETDKRLVEVGNCFATAEEAENPDSIDRVLTTMKDYYKKKSDAIKCFPKEVIEEKIRRGEESDDEEHGIFILSTDF